MGQAFFFIWVLLQIKPGESCCYAILGTDGIFRTYTKKERFYMDIDQIIVHLSQQGLLEAAPDRCERLYGGTVSELYLLHVKGRKYTVKQNVPPVVQSEAFFLKQYSHLDLLPNLLYTDPQYRFFVYTFVQGCTDAAGTLKKEVLKELVQSLLNHYRPAPPRSGWGWADEPSPSWRHFILAELKDAQSIIDTRLDLFHYRNVLHLAEREQKSQPFLLHGDCGFHNMIFLDGHLNGIIDPSPAIGSPLFDLVYAFCSTAEDLSKKTFDYAAGHLKFVDEVSPSDRYSEVLIGLYIRLARAYKHHPSDVDAYLKAWHYWSDIVNQPD